jgi:hypothetical protein
MGYASDHQHCSVPGCVAWSYQAIAATARVGNAARIERHLAGRLAMHIRSGALRIIGGDQTYRSLNWIPLDPLCAEEGQD